MTKIERAALQEEKRKKKEYAEYMHMAKLKGIFYDSTVTASRGGMQVTEMVAFMADKFKKHSYREDFVMGFALDYAMKMYKEIMDSGMSIHQYEESKKPKE